MEGNKHLPPPPPPCPQPQAVDDIDVGVFVKVMTDEQMEILGKQIAAYATICEQLEELHRTLSHNDDLLAGGVRSNPYSTTLMGSSTQKLSRRQRWNPTPQQLHILEHVFDQEGIKTPNPQKVREITSELAHHGQIAEPNVYNWFQNRRARLKKKQMFEAEANMAESGGEMVIESFDAKMPKSSQDLQSDENVSTRKNEDFRPEDALARTCIVTVHSLQGCPTPSRDFAKMTSHGGMPWEESHISPLNT